jgi:TRAP-type C4-dicarboxylate transport system permease large subunit
MRLAILGVLVAYLAVGGTEAYLHWYAGTQNTSTAHSMKEWYSAQDPQNGKEYHSSFVDLIFPAILLGLVGGMLTANQSKGVLVWCVFLLCLGLVALMPFYAAVTPTRDSDKWWTFASNEVRAVALVPGYFKAAMLCLFFGAVGRALGQQFRHIPEDL